jgi:hypothetical protein
MLIENIMQKECVTHVIINLEELKNHGTVHSIYKYNLIINIY